MDMPIAFLHPLHIVKVYLNSSLVLSFTMLLPDFSLGVFFLAYYWGSKKQIVCPPVPPQHPWLRTVLVTAPGPMRSRTGGLPFPIGFQLNMSVLSETNLLSPCWSLFPSYCEQTFGRERRTDGSQHIVLFIFSQFTFWSKLVFSSFSLGQESMFLTKL